MKRILINGTERSETRIAFVDDDRVYDYVIESNENLSIKSNIYLGVVASVKSDLESAFVDIGIERHGLLSLRTDRNAKIDETSKPEKFTTELKVGQKILVQVDKEPRSDKGATLTTQLSIPGRFVVVKPGSTAKAVSRTLNDEQREKLRDLGERLPKDDDIGWILRTSAPDRSIEELTSDYHRGVNLWRRIQSAQNENTRNAPVLLFTDNSPVQKTLRDRLREDGTQVIIDDAKLLKEAKEYVTNFMPELKDTIEQHRSRTPIFKAFRVDSQIQSAFERTISLRSGGELVFDPTEALLSIDVNSARNTRANNIHDTALNTNLQAAHEIARQLVLRNYGGLVVIDFIDMDRQDNRERVENEMRKALSRDSAKTECGNLSTFGLMELSRQRRRPSIYDSHYEECSHCHGGRFLPTTETLVNQFLRDLSYKVLDTRSNDNQFTCRLPENAAVYLLNRERVHLRELEMNTHKQIVIIPDATLEGTETEIYSRHVNNLDYEFGSNIKQTIEDEADVTKQKQRKELPPAPKSQQVALVSGTGGVGSERHNGNKAPKKGKGRKKTKQVREVEHPKGLKGWFSSLFSSDEVAKSQPAKGKSRSKSGGKQHKKSNKDPKARQSNVRRLHDKSEQEPKRAGDGGQRRNDRRRQSRSQGGGRSDQQTEAKNPKQGKSNTRQSGQSSKASKEPRSDNVRAERQPKEQIQASRRMPPSGRNIGRGRQSDQSTSGSRQENESGERSATSSSNSEQRARNSAQSERRPSPERSNQPRQDKTQDRQTEPRSKQPIESKPNQEGVNAVQESRPNRAEKQDSPKETGFELAGNDPRRRKSGSGRAKTDPKPSSDHPVIAAQSNAKKDEDRAATTDSGRVDQPTSAKQVPSEKPIQHESSNQVVTKSETVISEASKSNTPASTEIEAKSPPVTNESNKASSSGPSTRPANDPRSNS